MTRERTGTVAVPGLPAPPERHTRPTASGIGAVLLALLAGVPAQADIVPPAAAQADGPAPASSDVQAPEVAGDSALERRTSAVSQRLRCPVCQGLSIDDSPSPTARDMKAQVRRLVGEGKSDAEIVAYFESRYGEFVLLDPKPQGTNLLVWVTPGLAIAGGVIAVFALARRKAARAGAAGSAASSTTSSLGPARPSGPPSPPADDYGAEARRILESETGR